MRGLLVKLKICDKLLMVVYRKVNLVNLPKR